MKRKVLFMALCVAFLGVGIGIGKISAQDALNRAKKEEVENTDESDELQVDETDWETGTINYTSSDGTKTKLKDAKECYLCGDNKRSMMGLYRNYDDLGVICVNEWYVLNLSVRNHDDAGNLTDPTGYVHSISVGQGIEKGECSFYVHSNSDRGMADAVVSYGENSYLDVERVREKLCQDCLDKLWKVMEVRDAEGEETKPRDLCLVDFDTLELYSLQGIYSRYFVGDYWVEVDTIDKEELKVTVIYTPMLQNGRKEGQ